MKYTIIHCLENPERWDEEVREYDEDEQAIDYARVEYESDPDLWYIKVYQGESDDEGEFEDDPIYEFNSHRHGI